MTLRSSVSGRKSPVFTARLVKGKPQADSADRFSPVLTMGVAVRLCAAAEADASAWADAGSRAGPRQGRIAAESCATGAVMSAVAQPHARTCFCKLA
jgi:hypothetical protein